MAVSSFIQHMVKYELDEKNFLQWKQQVFLTVCSHGLEKFLTGEVTVPSAKVRNSEGELVENEAYERYIQQDCALASRLLLLTLLRLFSTMSTTKICDTLAASAASREPVSLEGVCSILVDAERRNLILQDLVVDHTQNANFVERWDILLIDASIGLVILYQVSPRAVIDHHDQCLQLICVLSHQLFQFFWTMFCPLMVHQLQCLLIVQF
ncbi:hypothetical protein E1A91_A01G221800v1 [Gossypium mustelinum]|uniref:Uncharacterized protein n=1 Tax=Gossypium mustelinum TaxID=34275 RepID=A0A5D3AIT5_GOSMU|nr:hypothetical protein E1A91_A01G221800v1 [Gossypium mustelinum]